MPIEENEVKAVQKPVSKYKGEKVLVVRRSVLDRIGTFQGFKNKDLEYGIQQLLNENNDFFLDRDLAENDPSHKQIIPYCVFRFGNEILSYTRGKSGNEDRLHAKISVGVGGHVNKGDGEIEGLDEYNSSLYRELDEELNFSWGDTVISNTMIGLLNDELNPVGQVHLGIVHLIELKSKDITAKEDCLHNLEFHSLEELNGPLYDRLETWSQFVIRHLAENTGE